MFRDDTPRAEKLASVLREARERKGYSQEELARKVNVSTETIRKIEQKKTSSPGVFLIADLARELGLKIQNLVNTSRRNA